MKIVKDKKILIGVSIFVLVAIIGIAYAAFTGQLSISGEGINRKSNYDIYFNNVSNFLTTGTASVTQSAPTNQSHTTVIEDYDATLISPGDSIYFTFDIVNDGDYDATLSSLTLGPVKCSVNGDETDPSATKVCNNITYTMKYTSDNSNVSINDTLASKETKNVQVTLTYSSNISSSDLPSSNVSISNLGIDMVYEADQTAKTNPNGSTPYERVFTIGEEITFKNEKYNVIGQGSDYVTLLKQQPLTANEVNENKIGSDGINHVNKNTNGSVGEAFNYSGYGGMAYYSSSTCGYATPGGPYTDSGCASENATSYASSDIKYVVDNWAANKFSVNELKTVDGYAARLVQKEELRSQFYPSCSESATWCKVESTTPSWLYNSSYNYWTMSQWNSSSTHVWSVYSNGNLSAYVVYYGHGSVRPVINVYKSKISS